MTVEKGEFLSITGHSGSGKSTLLHIPGFMDRPTKGEVLFEDRRLSKMGDGELTRIRSRELGFVFQTFNLFPFLDALGNVEIPMRMAGLPRSERRRRAEVLLARVGLEKRMGHLPKELSGGERQRVAIAQAMANSPKLILADEPTGNLDSATGQQIISLIRQINKEEGQTIVVVTHNPEITTQANRNLKIRDGQILD